MKPLITPAAMREMEQRYFQETGTASIDLMETASPALCDALIRRYGADQTIFFACGPGGNGGDGLACARLYARAGGRAFIALAGPPTSPDAAENLRRARAAGIADAPETVPDVWVDALYGTGLSRAPSGPSAELIERMNADRTRGASVVAVDIPSGLNGLTGRAYAPCVRADMTVTFQYAKPGCFLGDGLDVSGEVVVRDIGIPFACYPENSPALVDDIEVRRIVTPRPRNFHKGSGGHLLIVAGSFGMAGAAALCAMSALRAGTGLVTVACPESIVPILQTLAPCAMCVPLPERDGAISDGAVEVLKGILPGKTALACGCGLSRRASRAALGMLMGCGLPAVLDADALNLISEDAALKASLLPRHLVTPHPGEAARLLGHRVEDPIGDALALRALGCQALLKGAATAIVVDSRVMISVSGTSGMAKGGSGDCLTGLIGALAARTRGNDLALAAAVGSELHGLAGEIACREKGVYGMNAEDIVRAIPAAMGRYA